MGNTGLNLTKLSGKAGYNYDPRIPAPAQGLYVLGAGFGISDTAGFAEFTNDITVYLGENTALELNGAINIPASSPYYLSSNAKINYIIGQTDVQAKLNTIINFPAGSGSCFKVSNSEVNLTIQCEGIKVNGSNIKGQVFSQIDFNGNFAFTKPFTGEMHSGGMSGQIKWDKQISFKYPENFNSSSYTTASQTATFGFGVDGKIDINVNTQASALLDSNGVKGEISASVNTQADLKVLWPNWNFWEDNPNQTVHQYNCNVTGNVKMAKKVDTMQLGANLTCTYQDENGEIHKESADFDVAI
ncbi:hypothetical protein AAEX28_15330 [Lentisphaerota bacterium WC36G]|nr:hypothetical protein LJT99_02100 [Lentisphaerae bacterium WC36]